MGVVGGVPGGVVDDGAGSGGESEAHSSDFGGQEHDLRRGGRKNIWFRGKRRGEGREKEGKRKGEGREKEGRRKGD